MRLFRKKGASGSFSGSSTAEEVTHEIDATALTAIVTARISFIPRMKDGQLRFEYMRLKFGEIHPQVKGVSGEYFSVSNLAKPASIAEDATLAQKLWEFSMNLIKT